MKKRIALVVLLVLVLGIAAPVSAAPANSPPTIDEVNVKFVGYVSGFAGYDWWEVTASASDVDGNLIEIGFETTPGWGGRGRSETPRAQMSGTWGTQTVTGGCLSLTVYARDTAGAQATRQHHQCPSGGASGQSVVDPSVRRFWVPWDQEGFIVIGTAWAPFERPADAVARFAAQLALGAVLQDAPIQVYFMDGRPAGCTKSGEWPQPDLWCFR